MGGEVELETQNQFPEPRDEEGLSTEQQVHEALNNLSSACDIRVELRPCDAKNGYWLPSLLLERLSACCTH